MSGTTVRKLGGGIAGSGTLDYLTKWTPDGTTLGDSQIFDDGTNVGVGTNAPNDKFTVNGSNGQSISLYNVGNETISADFTTLNASGGSMRLYNDLGIQKVNFSAKASVSYINSGQNFGVGLSAPTAIAHFKGVDSGSVNYGLKVDNSAGSPSFYVRNDTCVGIGGIPFGTTALTIKYPSNSFYGFSLLNETYSTSQSDSLRIYQDNSGTIFYGNTAGNSIYRIDTNGRMGVNLVGAATATFHVRGLSATTVFRASNGSFSDILVVRENGMVGINEGTPTAFLQVTGLDEYADNAAASGAGLTPGAFYRTGDSLKVVH